MEMKRKGKLIIIEGADGAGKTTQVKLLRQKLVALKRPSYFFHFPDYQSFFGKQIKDYLDGKYGALKEVDPHFTALLYSLDRQEKKEKFQNLLNNGKIIICDRYTLSGFAYQGAAVKNSRQRQQFRKWHEQLEWQILEILKPDQVIYLHLPVNAASQNINGRNRQQKTKRDIHERDLQYQLAVQKEMVYHINRRKNWWLVNCVEKGRFLSPIEIHAKIWNKINKIV